MEQFIVDQLTYGLKYLPKKLAKSFVVDDDSEECRAFREKFGFICGVCHPQGSKKQITDANIGWVRFDIPFPFEQDGSLSKSYTAFKEKCDEYQANGLRVMAVTPYPGDYIEYGADIRKPEDEEKIREIARFIINDMQGHVSAMQVTNEMGIPRFTLPLNMDEAARFIAVHLEEMYPLRKDIAIGYNCAGPQADLHCRLQDHFRYCDYIGVDIYLGCFGSAPGFMFLFDALLRYLWAWTKKPIIMQEFGYIGDGAPKTRTQKKAILNGYGVKNKKDAHKNIELFVDNLPARLPSHTREICGEDREHWYRWLFSMEMQQHIYRVLPAITKIPGYPHTPEGQAKFFEDIMLRFYEKPYMGGAFVYCYADSDKCYVCGQSDCPVETRWGLVDCDLNPKPSYYAVRKVMGRIKFFENSAKR